ncbi:MULTISPECIES: hypothetical protein [unclassified Rickettsia]|uniref:hypothetical protein n=1 Tax=unclassified Rickettsia TaxID=114295 RepID=UPI0031333844
MAVAIQAIPNIMRDLIRILNKFSIKICLTGWPRRQKAPRHDGLSIHATMPSENDIEHALTYPCNNAFASITS